MRAGPSAPESLQGWARGSQSLTSMTRPERARKLSLHAGMDNTEQKDDDIPGEESQEDLLCSSPSLASLTTPSQLNRAVSRPGSEESCPSHPAKPTPRSSRSNPAISPIERPRGQHPIISLTTSPILEASPTIEPRIKTRLSIRPVSARRKRHVSIPPPESLAGIRER